MKKMYMLSLPTLMLVYVHLEFTIFLWNVVIRCLILVISSEFFLANKKIGFNSGFRSFVFNSGKKRAVTAFHLIKIHRTYGYFTI